ncbi:MBL fold metallo-hydrolase [Streptomyces sp. NPDC047042]|uniref:ComEC/Rec2 family competence protein n=1 Tax=Streptomyces sp. NPDC047042 TaxID=3154807 RepID=UPI003406D1EC
MIRVEALPAAEGDCLWVEWTHAGRPHRMLIDGGTRGRARLPEGLADRLGRLPVHDRRFDLVVCTHIDTDHIGGLLDLFTRPPEGFGADEVWFNGRDHLVPADRLGPLQGDRLAELLRARGVAWNSRAGGGPVMVPDDGTPRVFSLPGLRLTLLSPDRTGLAKLLAAWPEPSTEDSAPGQPDLLGDLEDLFDPDSRDDEEQVTIPWRELADDAGYERDRRPHNGSSIAFCAEDTTGARVLFGADAHAETLAASLNRLGAGRPYRVDLCKVPHHGSAHNISTALLDALDCHHWLISTHGGRALQPRAREARYRYGEGAHPSLRAMARMMRPGIRPTFWFNHRVPSTERYADTALAAELDFDAGYPEPGSEGIAVLVEKGRVRQAPPL